MPFNYSNNGDDVTENRATAQNLLKRIDSLSTSSVKTYASHGDWRGNNNNRATRLAVSQVVKKWKPEIIQTLGDNYDINHYPSMTHSQAIDKQVGELYHDYMYPYAGTYGDAEKNGVNRLLPCIGNHEMYGGVTRDDFGKFYGVEDKSAFLFDYLEGSNGTVNHYRTNNVHWFTADSFRSDFLDSNGEQQKWIKNAIYNSDATFKIVAFHQPPYTLNTGRSDVVARDTAWNWTALGIDMVVSGHDHFYARFDKTNPYFIINGAGGTGNYSSIRSQSSSGVQVSKSVRVGYGAMKFTVAKNYLRTDYFSKDNELVDNFNIIRSGTEQTFSKTTPNAGTGEEMHNGNMYLTSSDIEIMGTAPENTTNRNKYVGVFFEDIQIPQGALITEAKIKMQADESQSGATSINIRCGKSLNAEPFTVTETHNISNREYFEDKVVWKPEPWTAGNLYYTNDLSAIVQNVVKQDGWKSGNAISFIMDGTGHRTAENFNFTLELKYIEKSI